MDFHAIKPGGNGVACGVAVVLHDARNLFGIERAGLGCFGEGGDAVFDEHGFGMGTDGRGCHRTGIAGLQRGVRYAAHMPQLHHDLAACLVHGAGHFLPAVQLLGAVQAGHVGIALALGADGGGLRDDQARAGALRVVGGDQIGGNGLGRAVAGEGGHGNAVGQGDVTGLGGFEQGSHGHAFRNLDCTQWITASSVLLLAPTCRPDASTRALFL